MILAARLALEPLAPQPVLLPRPQHRVCQRLDPLVSLELLALALPGRSGKDGQKQNFVGAYSPDSRRKRIEKFLDKRQKRVWRKEVKYDVRKNFADSRLRVKGRFVKKEDEQLLRELLSFT
ncbi:CCT domain [Phytophthora cactorum]|nr:CCT domain [Phytophthora cactorum]